MEWLICECCGVITKEDVDDASIDIKKLTRINKSS